MRTSFTRRAMLAAALAAAAPLAMAQADYPNKPIRLLVGYSAGGGVDALARMLAARLPGCPACWASRWWWRTAPAPPA